MLISIWANLCQKCILADLALCASLIIIPDVFRLNYFSEGESTHQAASNPATSSQTLYLSPSKSPGQIDSSPITRSAVPLQPTVRSSQNINETVANNNNLTNHPDAAKLQELQLTQSLQLASPLLSQQLLPLHFFGNGLHSNTLTLLQQILQLQQHILQLLQNQQAAAATNRKRNSGSQLLHPKTTTSLIYPKGKKCTLYLRATTSQMGHLKWHYILKATSSHMPIHPIYRSIPYKGVPH